MSTPQFPDVPDGYTINDSIAQIITSIAMEEIGLSHIINAEGEKIQYLLGTLEGQSPQEAPTFEQLLELNDSVKDMLGQVSFSQMFLMGKMQAALNAYQDTPTPPTPPANMNILIAGGTGTDPLGTPADVLVVPFAQPPVLQIGNDVTLEATTAGRFDINVTGNYQITYQLAVYPQDVADGVTVIAELTSANLGIIDTIGLAQGHIVQGRNVTTQLQAGDIVSLVTRNQQNGSYYVNSQVITFVNVG
ncbi:MAG: hypothetical protein FWG14_06870 [Peptococcaceae bacterium]|nr:hypothetical protein [Peptococcaceae bacterium]